MSCAMQHHPTLIPWQKQHWVCISSSMAIGHPTGDLDAMLMMMWGHQLAYLAPLPSSRVHAQLHGKTFGTRLPLPALECGGSIF